MRFDVVTLFPEMFDALTKYGVTRRAAEQGKFQLQTWNPRDFTTDNYRTIDDPGPRTHRRAWRAGPMPWQFSHEFRPPGKGTPRLYHQAKCGKVGSKDNHVK